MKQFETIIVGGGASGLMCAIFASEKGKKVCVLEADVKVGKKILVSGNGRCNFSNKFFTQTSYNQNIDKFLNRFNTNNVVEFFDSIGLTSSADEEGRLYPTSNLSSSVLDVMLNKLINNNVEILTQTKVESIIKNNNGYLLQTTNGQFGCKNVVIACGNTVTSKMFSELNLDFVELTKSLCALKVSNKVNELNGIRLSNVKVSINVNDFSYSEVGELLFKDQGLSGICIMNLSALLARQKQHKAQVVVNMLPDLTQLQLIKTLKSRQQNLKNLVASKFFVGWFHKNVGYELLKRANISNEKSVAAFTDADINNLAQVMQNLTFNVVGVYDNNQVYSGGVKLTELDNNLQSLKHKNFYVCGEACNVDGLCGGYNLQWAWTSGKIVGETIAND